MIIISFEQLTTSRRFWARYPGSRGPERTRKYQTETILRPWPCLTIALNAYALFAVPAVSTFGRGWNTLRLVPLSLSRESSDGFAPPSFTSHPVSDNDALAGPAIFKLGNDGPSDSAAFCCAFLSKSSARRIRPLSLQ